MSARRRYRSTIPIPNPNFVANTPMSINNNSVSIIQEIIQLYFHELKNTSTPPSYQTIASKLIHRYSNNEINNYLPDIMWILNSNFEFLV